MGMIGAVGVVLHPRRDCTSTIRMITDWTRGAAPACWVWAAR